MTEETARPEDFEALELANTIQEIGLLVHESVDPAQAIQRIAARIREEMRASFAGIALVDADAGTIVHWGGALLDGGAIPVGPPQPLGVGVVGRAAATGETVVVDDVETVPDYIGLVPGIRSEVAIPLRHGGKVVGVLDVESRQVAAFGPEVVRALEKLSGAVTLAVQNARLVQEERRRLGQLTLLARIGRVMTSTVDLDELLARTSESIRSLLAYDLVSFGLVDDRAEKVVVRAIASGIEADLEVGRTVGFGEGVTGRVVQSGESLLVADVSRFEGYVKVSGDIRSEMCVPLKSGDRTFGFLDVESARPNAFSEADLAIVEALAEHFSHAVENAHNIQLMRQVREDVSEMVVDQLKKPLTPIQVALEGLELDLGRLGGEAANPKGPIGARLRGWIRTAEGSCSELHVLIDSLADINTVESGKLALKADHTTPTTILMGVWERIQPIAVSRGIALSSEIEEGLPALRLDAALMIRALQNLLVTAMQLTPARGVVTVRVGSPSEVQRARLLDSETGILFTVEHSGQTIPDGALPRVFEKFRVIEGQKGQKLKTGIGLAFCKAAVLAHGGAVWAEGLREGGNRFWVLLPLAVEDRPE